MNFAATLYARVGAILLALTLTLAAHAAQRQVVLVEHFTNTGCGPCATYNPGIHSVLNAMTRDTVIKISYHPWWPSSSDPFYLWNPSEITARTNYYGVSAVPDIFVDYTLQPDPSATTTLRSNIRTRYNTPSPCTIAVSAVPVSSTQIRFAATVTAESDMTTSNYRLYAMLITDLVTYASPPGSNGETSFPDPFRDTYPNANPGQPFTISAGQSYTMENFLNCSASWNYNDLTVVAFVQNSSTKEILQANWAEVMPNPGVLTLTVPNGGETWLTGTDHYIQWTSSDFSENVRIEINRAYPGGAWSTIAASAPNAGSCLWTVSGDATASARVRITGTVSTLIGDTSAANFSIIVPILTVTAPNGGESYILGDVIPITWTSENAPGPVSIEFNRAYPGGGWEMLASEEDNDGEFAWPATGATSSACRIRISSVFNAVATDLSDGNFVIAGNAPAVILHDPLDDQDDAPFTVTAVAMDERPGIDARFHYRLIGSWQQILMTATGNPNEYACPVPPLAEGEYEYYLTMRDSYDQTTTSETRTFRVAYSGPMELGYDDGTAEAAHWAADSDFQWAVKFSPDGGGFALCGARIGVSMTKPTTMHTPIEVSVLSADGQDGLPGTALATRTVGSVGNVIGGGTPGTVYWADVRFYYGVDSPLPVTGDFYIAVSNPTPSGIEAFLHDTSSTAAGRSFVFDGCTSQWRSETATDSVTKRGNRMIRALGFSLEPPALTATRSGSDIVLRWNDTGASLYRVYSAPTASGPFETLEGSTSATTFTDVGAVNESAVKFYVVKSVLE